MNSASSTLPMPLRSACSTKSLMRFSA